MITKDLFGIVTLVLAAAIFGLLLTHASQAGSLLSSATAATSELAETISNPNATTNLGAASFGSSGFGANSFGTMSYSGGSLE